MKSLLLISLVLMFSTAAGAAELVSKGNGTNRLRLMQLPCADEATLDQIKPERQGEFLAAEATISRGTFAGCWTVAEDGSVFLVFADGSTFAMPKEAFKLEPGV